MFCFAREGMRVFSLLSLQGKKYKMERYLGDGQMARYLSLSRLTVYYHWSRAINIAIPTPWRLLEI